MKRFYLLFISLLFSLVAVSQVVIKAEDDRYGIFNSHTKKWEVEPVYLDIRDIGIFDGRQYFAVCSDKGHKWGVIRSDNYKRWYLPPQLEDVACSTSTNMFSVIPILCMREKAGWGIIELGTGEFWYIRKGQYKSVRLDSLDLKVYCQHWDASKPDVILNDYDLKKAYDYVLREIDKRTDMASAKPEYSQTPHSEKTQVVTKPTCQILSPLTGGTYGTNTIRLRYNTNLSKGNYTVMFFVNGREVEPIVTGVEKGAKVEQGEEVELPMPQTLGEVVVGIRIQDVNGIWADPQSIKMMYVGQKPKPTLHIFAVGVSEYPATDLQDLNYADKDAQDFVRAITHSDLRMYNNIDATIILNKEATTSNIRTKLSDLSRNVKPDDVVMLFFSGHGINENEERYFVTYDASAQHYYNGVEFDFIRKRMKDMVNKHSHVIVFMDACHSGAMFGTKGNTKGITLATPGVIGFYSSTSDEKSAEIEDLGNGVFTRAILNAIDGRIANEEGEITAQQLWDFILTYVREKTNGRQTPIYENNIGEYVLLHVKKDNP